MEKIFYTDLAKYTTEQAVQKILATYYGKPNATVLRTKHGKPYVENGPFFSVTHTKDKLYIIVSDCPIGIDAESLSREPRYVATLQKFTTEEQAEIHSAKDFLRHWTAKESAVKYMGSTLAQDLKHLIYHNQQLTYKGEVFPAKLSFLTHEEHLLCVCGCIKLSYPVRRLHLYPGISCLGVRRNGVV